MRRSQLGYLRTQDYRHFEWLLEKLNIVYKPRPMIFERVIRRRHTERWVNFFVDIQFWMSPNCFGFVQIVLDRTKNVFLLKWILPLNCFRVMHCKTFWTGPKYWICSKSFWTRHKYLVLNIFEVFTLVPALRALWFPQKIVLFKSRVSGTVFVTRLLRLYPTYAS
jgi:hypothetical protein